MNRLTLFLIAGSLAFVAADRSLHLPPLSGDWLQALQPARDYLLHRPALSWPASMSYVPSPLTIVPFGLPLAFLDYRLGSSLFFGLSCGWLAAGLERRRFLLLPLFLSFPFFENVLYIQYAPFLMALALSDLSPIGLLVKPHIALPLVLTQRFRWWSVLLVGAIVAWSFLTFGPWPLRWLQEIQPYSGRPAFLTPIGAMALLLALCSRQWLIALYCLIPARSPYDLLPLFLAFQSFKPAMLFALASWLLGFWAVWFVGYSGAANAAILFACSLLQVYGPIKMRGGAIVSSAPPPVNGSGSAP